MFRRIVATMLCASLIGGGFVAQAQAAVIGTQQALAVEQRAALLDEVQAKLAREEVRRALVELGVDPRQAQQRVAALSDQELAQLNGRLDDLPAGGDGALALIGAVFLVLLILELTGVIDVFKRA